MNSRQIATLRELPGVELVEEETARYQHDYSIFAETPTVIVRPLSVVGLSQLMSWASHERVPLVARAGGSNTGGAAITDGMLVLMTDEHFADLSVDPESRRAHVGCAVRHDVLQRALREYSFWLPSDPSSGPLSFIGGNVNTRASGPHALRYGAIDSFVETIEGVLPDGTRFSTSEPETIPVRLTNGLSELASRISADRQSRNILEAKRGLKCASGYDLLALLDAEHPIEAIPRLICGSMGTLCLTTAVTLRCERVPGYSQTLFIPFPSQQAACAGALALRGHAAAVEILSESTAALVHNAFGLEPDGERATIILAEYQANDQDQLREQLDRAKRLSLSSGAISGLIRSAADATVANEWWTARKTLLPRLQRSTRGKRRLPYSVVNDVGVDPKQLGALLEKSESVFRTNELPSVIYGHAGSGNLHLRPLFRRGDEATVRKVALEIYTMVTELEGTITAEHGMGRLRAPFLASEWGKSVHGYMLDLKAIFDPDGILNPKAMFVSEGHDFSASGWASAPTLE